MLGLRRIISVLLLLDMDAVDVSWMVVYLMMAAGTGLHLPRTIPKLAVLPWHQSVNMCHPNQIPRSRKQFLGAILSVYVTKPRSFDSFSFVLLASIYTKWKMTSLFSLESLFMLNLGKKKKKKKNGNENSPGESLPTFGASKQLNKT